MTDLTLYEYRDLSEEELGQMLHEEVKKMFDSDSLENELGEAENCSYTPFLHKYKRTNFIFQYRLRITDFIQSNIQKIFSNSTRTFFIKSFSYVRASFLPGISN